MKSKKGLGKGLSALLRDEESSEFRARSFSKDLIEINQIKPGKQQPRHLFEDEALRNLADSIRTNGVIQPILIRNIEGSGAAEKYEIIAGERRWRAAKLAGLSEIPAIIQEVDDKKALEFALIENIQRQDLTPIEEAEAYKKLCDEYNYSQDELAKEVGKSRSHITNMLRLLQLPQEVKDFVQQGKISMGHARALINSSDPLALAQKIMQEGLNVREIEAVTSEGKRKARLKSAPTLFGQKDEDVVALEETLSASLGMKVEIQNGNNADGKVIINFGNLSELDKILQKLTH